MLKPFKNLAKSLPKKVSHQLIIIVSAAVLLQLISVVQYYYMRGVLRKELDHRVERELKTKVDIIQNTQQSAEATMAEHVWDMQSHLGDANAMFDVTKRLIEVNHHVMGGCMAFVPNYYPEKGRYFETYAHKESGQIVVEQIGGPNHDYTQHEAFQEVLKTKEYLWSDPYLYETKNGSYYLTTYSYPLLDKNGNLAAVCGLDIDLSWLDDTLNAHPFYPSSFAMLLTDSEGSTDNEVRSYVATQAKKNGDNKGKAYIHYASMSNSPYWKIALINYEDEIYAPINKMRLRNFLIMLAGLPVLFYIVNRFARNEKRLQLANIKEARISSELDVAHKIQQGMLPKTLPKRSDLDVFGSLVPAKEVGGDLFDYFIRDEKLFFSIGDVSGKGVPSAIVMAMVQSQFRTISDNESNPSLIIESLNKAVCRENEMDMFVTFFLGVLDLQTGILQYCNAGHDKPMLNEKAKDSSEISQLPAKANLPIGVFDEVNYELQEYQLSPDTTLFLYTDGLTEAKNRERQLFKVERVLEVFKGCNGLSSKQLLETMKEAVGQFVDGAEQSDDLTLLAIRYQQQTES